LKPDEYERIVQFMGREPNLTELGIFSVMWSEHCSYKSSRGAPEDAADRRPAGAAGPGRERRRRRHRRRPGAVFKIDSHNHPSFIEPYQGAATGVGGIIRDISPWARGRSRC
jgi:phosphoribosylformylglycinamidine synthase